MGLRGLFGGGGGVFLWDSGHSSSLQDNLLTSRFCWVLMIWVPPTPPPLLLL